MPNIDDMTSEIVRRTMTLFFLIDTSGSMRGEKIGAVNAAMEDTIPDLRKLVNADSKVNVAVLRFSTGAEWQSIRPVDVQEFEWNRLEAEGLTELGLACMMLNEKLSRKGFMDEINGCYAPAIILLSDGNPTDDYKTGLSLLQNNSWFKQAIKVALAVGKDVKKSILAEFTGSIDSVISINNKSQLNKIVHFVSIRASQIASRSSLIGEDNQLTSNIPAKQIEFNKDILSIDLDSGDVDDDIIW